MIVHFICRGNAFRSIIAEAYLNSLKFKNLRAISSGTTAAVDRARNLVAYTETLELLAKNGIQEFAKAGYGDQLTPSRLAWADVVICMNQRVYDECQHLVGLPAGARIWSVADIGEPGRVAHTEDGKARYREEAYLQIVDGVGQLITELSQGCLCPGAHPAGPEPGRLREHRPAVAGQLGPAPGRARSVNPAGLGQ